MKKGQLSFDDVVKQIVALPLQGERNIWLKAMSAQILDSMNRVGCTACTKRHLAAKLVSYYQSST